MISTRRKTVTPDVVSSRCSIFKVRRSCYLFIYSFINSAIHFSVRAATGNSSSRQSIDSVICLLNNI